MDQICPLKIVTLLILTFQPVVIASNSASPPLAIYGNISYGADPQQVMDIYLPAGRNTTVTKVIVLIHGGGWSGGTKNSMQYFVYFFYIRFPQHAIVNIGYRLATIQSPGFPKQIQDINTVLQFLRSKATEYSVNPSFALVGVSAGAHLSMLYGYGYDAAREVRVICNIVGPSNLADPAYTGNRAFDWLMSNLVGNNSFVKNPQIYYAVSPVYKINSSSPRTISFYGANDPLIPVSQGNVLEDKLDDFGVYNKYYLYPGGGHMGWTPEQNAHMFKKIIYFFKNYF